MRPGAIRYSLWLLFALCLLVYVTSSAITTVPGSTAEEVNGVVCPLFLLLTIVCLGVAVWRTVAEARNQRDHAEQTAIENARDRR